MRKFSLCLLVLMAISACSNFAPQMLPQTAKWKFSTDKIKSVSITNLAGDIVVHPAQGNDILITTTISGQTPAGSNGVDVHIQPAGETLRGTVDYPAGTSSASVAFDIYAPLDMSIQIESASGSITIEDYQGVLELSTSSGKMILQDVKGEIRASTASGDIETHNVDGNFHISSSGGNIVATYDTALPQVENPVLLSDVQTLWTYKITATGNQQVQDVSSPNLPGHGQRIFENSSGAITLCLAPDLQVDIFAQLFSENFKSDVGDMKASADKVRHVGILNGGGPLIILTSSSGAIHVETLSNP